MMRAIQVVTKGIEAKALVKYQFGTSDFHREKSIKISYFFVL